MSKQVIIILGIVIVLLIGGAVFLMMNKSSNIVAQKQSPVTEQTNKPVETTAPTKGTIQSLLTAGKSVSCTITYPDQKDAQGTIYVSGSKMRGDFTTTVADKPVSSHMISSGGTAYLWTDGTKQGTKMSFDASQSAGLAAPSGQPKTADLNTEVEQNCQPWNVDSTKFTVPTDIQFVDLSQLMKNLPTKSGSNAPKIDKSLCDAITDAKAKASCLKALGGT